TRADQIFTEVSSQLIQTGRLTPEAAKYSASIIPAYVTSRAARSGLSVDEIYDMMGLKIIGPELDLATSQGVILDQAKGNTAADVVRAWADLGIDGTVAERDNEINLSKIIVPESDRGAGRGSAAMKLLLD